MDTWWLDVPDAPGTSSGGVLPTRSATTPRTTNPWVPFTTRTMGRSAFDAALPSRRPATVRRWLACGSRADLQILQQSPRSGPGAGAAEVEHGPGPVPVVVG